MKKTQHTQTHTTREETYDIEKAIANQRKNNQKKKNVFRYTNAHQHSRKYIRRIYTHMQCQ